jgi:hypothetical protein
MVAISSLLCFANLPDIVAFLENRISPSALSSPNGLNSYEITCQEAGGQIR